VHLGHIINCKFDDNDDVIHRCKCFIGQANNLLCFFNKLDMFVKLSLFKSYCSSMYGCELWSLSDSVIEDFCIAWRKALRRVLNLPYKTHNYLLPILSNSLPLFIEICKRSAHFIFSCINSRSSLVRFIAWHGIDIARYNSCIGSNALFCCSYFNCQLSIFLMGNIYFNNDFYTAFFTSQLSQLELDNAKSLSEVLCVREGVLVLTGANFNRTEISDIITAMAC